MPMSTIAMPRSTRLRATEGEDQDVERDEQPEAEVVPVRSGMGHELEASWIASPANSARSSASVVEQPGVRAAA